MKATLFSFVLLCAASVSFAGWTRQINDCAERGTIGLICSLDCEHVAFCRKEGTKWIREEVDTCTGGQKCNLLDNGCSDKQGACSSEAKITCNNEGLFPDPFDCQRYYYCTDKGQPGQMKECGTNKAYDVSTSQCTMKTSDAICLDLPVKCEKPGEHGPWPANENLYYICKSKLEGDKKLFYPVLFKCEAGAKYDKVEGCKE